MIDQLLILVENIFLHIPLLLGAYISFSLLKVPDLSLESAYVSGAIMSATVLPFLDGYPLPLQLMVMILVSMAGGGLVGLTSSLLTSKGGFSHLLSCIITFGIFYGINQFIGGAYISLATYQNPLIMALVPRHPEIITVGIIGGLLIMLVSFLFKTQLGYCFAVYGNNPLFFKHYGINGTYVFITAVIVSNMLAGLSGYCCAQSNGFVEINMAFGKALLCITALILGKVFVVTKRPLCAAIPIVGLLIYFALQQLLLKSGFNLKYFTTIQALVVLIVLLLFKNNKSFDSNNLGI